MGLLYDNLNSFGTLTAAGTFPNTLNLGPNSGVERMTVDFHANNLNPGASISFTISMAPDNNGAPGAWVALVQSETLDYTDLNTHVYQLPVPVLILEPKLQYIRITTNGGSSWSSGTIEAVLNTYVGK